MPNSVQIDINSKTMNHKDSATTEIKLPEGLTLIEESAFDRCRNLTKISLPAKILPSVDPAAFDSDRLEGITVECNQFHDSKTVLNKCREIFVSIR